MMDTQAMLIELSKAATMVTGSVAILMVFTLATGGLIWLWLQAGKWIARYIHKVGGEFREAFRQVNSAGKVKVIR